MQPASTIKPGDRFAKLTVVAFHGHNKWGTRIWECLCDCGNTTFVQTGALRAGTIKACGCLLGIGRPPSHGMTNTKEFRAWTALNNRCYNPRNPAYPDYGGRGILVYEPWRTDFMAFYDHIGPAPSPRHSVDRINYNGNYEPGNVRWATDDKQQRNKRSNINFTVNGVTRCCSEWARITGIPKSTLGQRRRLGWSDERAVNTPSRPINRDFRSK